MEKIYTNAGYRYTDKNDNVVIVSCATVEKAISDHNKLLANIQKNLDTLNIDLDKINAS